MESVIWEERPVLRNPAALIAFEGWGDAGSSSSMAVDHLIDLLAGYRFARIDSDEFFDFTVRRPLVEIGDGGTRNIEWPDVSLHALTVPGADRDLVVVTGDEPSVRWKRFCSLLRDIFESLGVREAVTLGAFVGQVPHTLPVPLVGVASHPDLLEEHHLFSSDYEGPTGIIGVLNHELMASSVNVISVWAAVPHYLSNQEYPPGSLALLDKALEILDVSLDTSDLKVDAVEFREQVDRAVEDSDLAEYIGDLEAESLTGDESVDPAEQLVEEIERFLNDG
ncbi:MAG: PAC2 family protein [Acidimicrobiia bacterium]|nr:PAC2 family protein [Acidimicrobiia bacterium]MDH4307947.1 PAC2 family protein [Acidimicrobiia bacterium]MDH5293723.1 PAC2 family protein [Acidimicrobiia bacterium]